MALIIAVILIAAAILNMGVIPTFPISGIDIALVLLAIIAAAGFFIADKARKKQPASHEETVEELEQAGLLVSTVFVATRAFRLYSMGDEGPHYFIELDNGNVLYMNGQYLDDYEDWDDEDQIDVPEDRTIHQEVTFPSTEFTLRSHRKKGFVVDIQCRGRSLHVENEALVSQDEQAIIEFMTDRQLSDREIITDHTFDELRTLFQSTEQK